MSENDVFTAHVRPNTWTIIISGRAALYNNNNDNIYSVM